jgi:hypothetical protein
MARTNYPFHSSQTQKCSITTLLVVLNINRADADLVSIRRKVKELLRKNNLTCCKTLKSSLQRLLTHYYRHDHALPTLRDLSLYKEDEVIDLTMDD